MKHMTRLSQEMPAQAQNIGDVLTKPSGILGLNEWGDLPIVVALWLQNIPGVQLLPDGYTTSGGKGSIGN